jgi:N-acetylglucosaminyldiphosphoundecaprenol N-acetyl-beta-D-mannosaminyltransferase
MRIEFLGIPVDALSMQETVNYINENIDAGKRINHVVINAGKVVAMQTDNQLYESVVACDLINADGQSIVWASKFLGSKLPGRVAGIDLMEELVFLAAQKKYKCFFFGAKENIVKRVVDFYSEKYGKEIIAGYRNGYFLKEDEAEIARQIGESGAQILFVAITSPRKEKFLYTYRKELADINFTMGVGGSFDVISGLTKRAPHWMRINGLEWFYRLAQEPRRMWRRYFFGNFMFIRIVLEEKIRGVGFHKKKYSKI